MLTSVRSREGVTMLAKIMIDEHGCLLISRAGRLKNMLCPYDQTEGHCGDWCSLFGEPKHHSCDRVVELSLCQTTLTTYNLEDRRKEENQCNQISLGK